MRCAAAASLLLSLLLSGFALAESSKLSEPQREQIIRAFLAERPFAQCDLPTGKAGIVVEGGKTSPSPAEIRKLVERSGAAARAGERVQITNIRFLGEGILFEINGVADKHRRWTDHISVGMGVPGTPNAPTQDDRAPERRGFSVLLKFNDGAALTPERIRTLLAPVLDFRPASLAEAYQKTLPPVLAAALKHHRALVGMDRDLVLAALGRPPHRLRETGKREEYEEWIYGSPPQEVQFIRFVRGKVVRIEQMKVTGEKVVRTKDEVGDLGGVLASSQKPTATPAGAASDGGTAVSAPAMAAPGSIPEAPAPEAQHRKPPSLLRPGESLPGGAQPAPIALPASVPEPPPAD